MKNIKLLFGFVLILVAMVVGIGQWVAPAGADLFADYDFLVVRAYYSDERMIQQVLAWGEPWDVNSSQQYLLIDVTPDKYADLVAAGFRLEVDLPLTTKYNQLNTPLPGQTEGIPGYPCYRTVEETFSSAAQLTTDYPELAQWLDVGDSWDKVTAGGSEGYDMMVLRLTNQAIAGPKPVLFITSAIHAREYPTAELNTRFAEYLLSHYGTDADATWLLNYHDIRLMLQANPDGRKIAEAGQLWRKNRNNTDGCLSSFGVDLNRNFNFFWGAAGASNNPCDETYLGSAAGSEPETMAIQDYMAASFIDQREPDDLITTAPITTTGIYIDLHNVAEVILWPWGWLDDPSPNHTGMQTLARKLGYFNNYGPSQHLSYFTSGTTKDYAYGRFGVPGYTIELGEGDFFSSCTSFEQTILPDNLSALLFAAKAARYSYIIPAGPESLSVALSATLVTAGEPVLLTATANDNRFNNSYGTEPTQNIVAAEYYLDAPDWFANPTAWPMSASDGNFNNSVEGLTATIDTTGLASGRHTVYVRSQDAAGNWGAYSAIFLTIFDPAVAPVIEGFVTAADSGQPLAATVTAGSYQTNTDPDTGFYQMQVISGTYTLTAAAAGYAPQSVVNVQAHDLQTIEQNFSLTAVCNAYVNDVENGANGWTGISPWAITTEASHSPTHAWTESVGGNYANNRDVRLTSPIFNLNDYDNVTLAFWHICDTQASADYCKVEVSSDGGVNWSEVASFNGPHNQWEEVVVGLPTLNHVATGRVRFRFISDASVVADGWHIDDIRLQGSGNSCAPVAPTASFSSNSPVALGQAVQFTNASIGDNLSYLWDFGDGASSTDENPSHTYAAPGFYDVTLTATNPAGSDDFTAQVEVAILPEANFSLASGLLMAGQAIHFVDGSAGTSLNYLWDFGDGTSSTAANPSHTYTQPGNYQVSLTISNSLGSDLFTLNIQIQSGIFLPVIVK